MADNGFGRSGNQCPLAAMSLDLAERRPGAKDGKERGLTCANSSISSR